MGKTKAVAVEFEQLEIAIPEAARRLDIVYIPRALIHPDPDQPRVDADDELRAKIAREGVLQPLTLRPHPTIISEFMIVDGERRWRGSEGVQDELPAIVRQDKEDPTERLITQLIANSGKPLTPMEEARAFARVMEAKPGTSLADLAKISGTPRSTVGDRLSLLQLGPWVEQLDAGRVQISHATRFLIPFKKVPDKYHAEAVKAFLELLGDDAEPMDVVSFQDDVCAIYHDFLHPLTKLKGSYTNPAFDTKDHDQECDCGRISVEDSHGDLREFCGNPDWWKPLEKAAKAAEKAKEKKSSSSAPKKSAPRGPRWAMPTESKTKDLGYNQVPNDHFELTGTDGKWKLELNRVMSDEFFDPSTVEIRPKNLVLLKQEYGSRVATRDDAAVKEARKAWKVERSALLDTAIASTDKIVKAKAKSAAVEGKGARVVLQLLLGLRSSERAFDLLDAALLAHVPVPPKAALAKWEGAAAAVKWAGSLTDKQASAVLTVIAFVCADAKVEWPSAAVQDQLTARAEKIAKLDSPWVGKGKDDKQGAASDEADDE